LLSKSSRQRCVPLGPVIIAPSGSPQLASVKYTCLKQEMQWHMPLTRSEIPDQPRSDGGECRLDRGWQIQRRLQR
jgi:hypothetical protein